LHLNVEDAVKINVNLPPLKEQQKIAEILTSADEVIENTQSQINKLEDLKKATMNELLTKGIGHTEFKDTEIGRIPKSWTLRKLLDISEVTSSKRVMESDYCSDGVRFYRSKEIIEKANGGSIGKGICISQELFDSLNIKFGSPKSGDILITAVGTIGVVYQVGNEQFYFKDGNLLWLRNIQGVSSNFLFVILNSAFTQNQIKVISAGSSQSALTIEKLKEIVLPIPQKHEQMEIYDIANSLTNKIQSAGRKLQQLYLLKNSLMQDLLTGKVRVTVN
jgi:type I restriction enzyme S subunit